MQNQLNKDYLLWKSFKEGDDVAFYALYDQYSDALFRFGMQFCNDDGFVKDCIHDLFLDLHKYREKLGATDSIQFYLFRSLRRKMQKQKPKDGMQNLDKSFEKTLRSQTPTFEEALINSEIQQENIDILGNAVSQLTKLQQKALFLKFEEELAYPEIAILLNISVESARTNIYRALKSLRKTLTKKRISLNLFFQLLHSCSVKSSVI
jgi:RNA polymerase sigma factor (sigma-70 family)